MKEAEMEKLVGFMLNAVENRTDEAALSSLHEEVKDFCKGFPVPGIEPEYVMSA